MAINPKENLIRITQTLSGWKTLRPEKVFAGLSLAQCEEKLAPSLKARDTIARLDNEQIAAQNQRDDADRVSLDVIQRVISAVKADGDEGEDGELYEAMGYVRKSERRSGLTRKGKVAATTPKA